MWFLTFFSMFQKLFSQKFSSFYICVAPDACEGHGHRAMRESRENRERSRRCKGGRTGIATGAQRVGKEPQ